MGAEWIRLGKTGPGSACQSGQIAAFGFLQLIVAYHAAGLLQRAQQDPDSSTDGCSPAAPSSTGDEPDDAARARLGLDSQEPLGVGHSLDDALAMQVEGRIG